MEICVAAEARLQGGIEKGQPPATTVNREESLEALPLAILDQRDACLLFEKAAETRPAESAPFGEGFEIFRLSFIAQQSSRLFNGRMHVKTERGGLGAVERRPGR